MTDLVDPQHDEELAQEFELDAPPETVWRAVSIAAYRERWLPGDLLTDAEPLSSVPGETISFGMRDDQPPFLASEVTFQIAPTDDGGTRLRIIHRLADARRDGRARAANANRAPVMRAA